MSLHGKCVSLPAKGRNGREITVKLSNEVNGEIHLVYYTKENGIQRRNELYISEHALTESILQLKDLDPSSGRHAAKGENHG